MKNGAESELNEKTNKQDHQREFGKKSDPFKLRVEIAAHWSQWQEAGKAKGHLALPGCRGSELTLEGAWLIVF